MKINILTSGEPVLIAPEGLLTKENLIFLGAGTDYKSTYSYIFNDNNASLLTTDGKVYTLANPITYQVYELQKKMATCADITSKYEGVCDCPMSSTKSF